MTYFRLQEFDLRVSYNGVDALLLLGLLNGLGLGRGRLGVCDDVLDWPASWFYSYTLVMIMVMMIMMMIILIIPCKLSFFFS